MSTRESYSELKVDKTPLRVTPVTNYDPFEAKFCASLYWLIFRATENGGLDDIPPQVTSPIERDAENRITVRPEVVELLTNDEIYGKVCDCIFNNKEPVVGHWAVIQCLSRHGFYVVEEGDIAVTDSTLQQRKPFRKSTHLALMDALMAAYSSKVVTVPQVVQTVRKFATFNASKELPFDLEDSLLLWINKVCTTLNDNEIKKQKLHAEDLLRDQDKAKRFRFRRDQLQPKVQTLFPVIDDLLKGISDGQCLLGLMLFYHQDAVRIDDIHFGEDISQEKVVLNIELFRSLCSQHICTTALSLQVEDFMYSSHAMKPNLIALLAEMFYKCEVEEDQTVEETKHRSKSCTHYQEDSDAGIKEDVTKNLENNRSSSAPMLASEIISARSPAVGKKLMDLAKEKNKQHSVSSPDKLSGQIKEQNTQRKPSSEKPNKPGKNPQNRSYSLQLDFTDDREGATESNKENDAVDEENPFNHILRKPVLASRKYGAPDRVAGSPRMPPKPEPRLNKRAKQKPRTLALEDWEMEDKDMEDIHVADIQRSQSLTGLDKTGMEPRRSFHAWQEETSSSDTNLDLKRSQRITLAFRPTHQVTSSQAYERGRDKLGLLPANYYDEDRGSQDSIKSNDSLNSKPLSLPSRNDGYLQENSQSCTSSMSARELKEFEEMEAMVLARRSNDSNKDTARNTDVFQTDEDLLNASVSSDDMNRFRLEVLQRLTEDKLRCMEKGTKEQYQPAIPDGDETVGSRSNEQQSTLEPNGEASEDLSTINESSEPLLSLPDTCASTPSTTPSSPCSPLEVAPFMPVFFMTSPANTIDKKAYKKAVAAKNKQDRKDMMKVLGAEAPVSHTPRFEALMRSEEMSPKNKSLDIAHSYTVDKTSIDAAKAAGIPVVGNSRVSELTLSAAYRTTTRSLSVPEPLEDTQGNPIHDRVSISSSHLPGQGYGDPVHQLSNFDSQSKSPLAPDAITYVVSPRSSEDVVIFDRKTSDVFQDPDAHAHERLSRGQQVDQGAVLTSSYARQSFIDGNVQRSVMETNPGQYGGSVGIHNDPVVNRQANYQEQLVAAVSNRLINPGQFNDEIDASHVRVSQRQDTSRNSFVSNTGTYIRNSPRDSRSSFVSTAPRNSLVDQNMSARNSFVPTPVESVRNSFGNNPEGYMVGPVGNQGTDFRHSFASSTTGVDSSRNSAYIADRGPDPHQEPRLVYSDQYGTYVKGAHPQNIPQGHQGASVPGQRVDNQYSSPRQSQEKHSSPGQFATFRKLPGSPVIQRQPSPGYSYEQHIPTNHNTVPYSASQVTSSRNGNEQNYRMATSQQYPSTGQAQSNPYHQSASIYSNSPLPFHQDGSSTYRTEEYRPGSQQQFVDTYRGPVPNQHGYEPNFGPRVTQVQENIRTQSPQPIAARTQSSGIQNGEYTPRDSETPQRRSQAFTVDLNTGELLELNSSSDSTSPRSPGSNIIRSKTFKKGPEERVFDYGAKALPGQQNQEKMSPQKTENGPAVADRKENILSRMDSVEKITWADSAKALNYVPKKKKEERVRRTKSESSDSSNPTPLITWLTEGSSGRGSQVMVNEKGEIEDEIEDEIEESLIKEGEENPEQAKFLAIFRLHVDQLRRQVEAGRRRKTEEWNIERRKLGERLLRYAITREQESSDEPGPVRPGEHEGSMRMNEPLRIITKSPRVTEYSEPTSSGQPTPPIGVSTPLECMSPVSPYPIQSKPSFGYQSPTVEGYQSPRDPGHQVPALFGHGYHQTPLHRPGYQSPTVSSPVYQSPISSQAGYQSPLSFQANHQPPVSSNPCYQSPVSSNPCYQSPVSSNPCYQSPLSSSAGYQSPISSQAGFQFPSNNGTERQSRNGTGYQGNVQMLGYQTEAAVRGNHPIDQGQEYETREFRLSEYPPHVSPPSRQDPENNGPLKSPSRRCWDVNSPTISPSVVGAASQPFTVDTEGYEKQSKTGVEPQDNTGINEEEDTTSKKAFSMFIGDEPEEAKEGLTSEQQKKRDRFLRNRQKKMEEEKARKEVENERKKQREKKREMEIQKKVEDEERRSETQRRERLAQENGRNKPRPESSQPEDHSAFAEFSGPQCYVKPSGKSNRKLIINAISHVCLSGSVNNDSKEKCLQAIADSQGFHFMVLFKDELKFRGVYVHNPENEQSFKIYGIGPKVIGPTMIEYVYKYNSGGKEFIKIASKSLSLTVDGVAINKVYWTKTKSKRPPRPPPR